MCFHLMLFFSPQTHEFKIRSKIPQREIAEGDDGASLLEGMIITPLIYWLLYKVRYEKGRCLPK